MRIPALPPSTLTRGLPSGPTDTVTSGLLPGACGGSHNFADVTVPASVAEADEDPAAGDFDSTRWNGTGQRYHRRLAALREPVGHRQRALAPWVAIGALANRIDDRVTDMIGRAPAVRVFVGGFEGLLESLFEGVRLDGDGVGMVA